MRCITLTQPWATLVAIGAKKIETRSWGTNHRGPLAIHVARAFPAWARRLCLDEPFCSVLLLAELGGWDLDDDRGKIIAVTTITSVSLTGVPGCGTPAWIERLSATERAFGDYGPGHYAWGLGDVRILDPRIPVRGRLGLWDCDDPRLEVPA